MLHQLLFEELTCAQFKVYEALEANLFLQFGLLESFSTKCGFDVLPPHSPVGPQRGSCSVFYLVFHKEGFLNSSEMNSTIQP